MSSKSSLSTPDDSIDESLKEEKQDSLDEAVLAANEA